MISDKAKQEINTWIAKYPDGKKSSAVMQTLKIVAKENSEYLSSDLIKTVAEYLQMPVIQVYEVATFYENYNHKPVAKNAIKFCHSISCMLNDVDNLISYTEEKIGAKNGEISKDSKFSVEKVECLGACIGAPMCQIGEDYYENLTKAKINEILGKLK